MHKGNPSLAVEMVRQASLAGADIAKFQLGHDPKDPLRYVGPDMGETIANACSHYGVEFMASIFSLDGLKQARDLGMKRYKIAHQKADDEALVEAILADGNDTFVSGTLRWKYPHVHPIWVSPHYPTYAWDFDAPTLYQDWFGYSDHTHGIGACLLAVARGAKYIEKHFCLDKTDLSVRDTPFSATPCEFAALVRYGKEIEQVRHGSNDA